MEEQLQLEEEIPSCVMRIVHLRALVARSARHIVCRHQRVHIVARNIVDQRRLMIPVSVMHLYQ